MPWPKERRVLGQSTPRLDGPAKVAGAARYTYDQNPTGLCHGVVLYAPLGRARITRLDLEPARRMPGVRAVIGQKSSGGEIRYHGEYVAAVAADTEAQARDAVRAIVLELEPLEALTTEEAASAAAAPKLLPEGNQRAAEPRVRGDVEAAMNRAEVAFEGRFRCHVVTHVCLETHGAVAAWDGNRLTVWSSTQAVSGCRNDLARSLQLPPADVEVITEYMGGGFGSKLGGYSEELTAARLAREAGRPVKLMLDREMEHTFGGCRRSAIADIKLGADRQGNLLALDAVTMGTGGIAGRGGINLPYIYRVGAARQRHTDVATNAGNMRAMRAPGHPQASFVMESALEGLALKLGMDPLQLRRRNLPENSLWQRQLTLGAERIGWAERPATGSQTGRHRRGMGCAVTSWGGSGHNSNARVAIHGDGGVEVFCSTQDIGTGTRTALAVVAAETFGLEPQQITVHIGHGSYPPSGGSGGSTTIAGVSASTRAAAEQALGQLLARLAPALGAQPAELSVVPGGIAVGGTRRLSWQEACRRIEPDSVSAEAPRDPSLGGGGVNGAQFAEVEVDTETGIVKMLKVVAVQDCGLVVNRLTAESQVYGGVIMGIGFALFEERILDPGSGRMLNPNLEFYRIPGPSDMPVIEVHLDDQPERGVIGIGEPPTIPTASAIANAVTNALGRQLTELPLTPERVLMALEASR